MIKLSKSITLFTATDTEDGKAGIFLLFLFITAVGQSFISHAFKFIAFELSSSESIVSLIGSINAAAFISFGLISGMIVDAVSRRFFAVFHLLAFTALSILFYVMYRNELASIGLLFAFIAVHQTSMTFHDAAKDTIFYDLCGTTKLSRWISRRSMVFSAASITALLALTLFVGSEPMFFVVYAAIMLAAYLIFRNLKYTDQNKPQVFTTSADARRFFIQKFREFIKICIERKALLFLFLFSFFKTFFIFWPMTSGALFKFGIEDDHTRRLYLIAMVLMSVVSMVSFLVIGRKHTFSNRTFVIGAFICGVSILLFALVEGTVLCILTLSIMYVGFAVSAVSSSCYPSNGITR